MLFRAPVLDDRELEVIESIENTRRRLRRLLYEPTSWRGLLRRSAAAGHIRASTAIEGHHVSRDDALAAVDQAEPFEAKEADWAAVLGCRDAMDYIIRLTADPHFTYSGGLIRGLHYMMMKHDSASLPGLYRSGVIFAGDYEGPDPDEVPGLVEELAAALNDPDDHGPALVRAGMAHLNMLMIHPFRDGNGRISRALHTLAMGRAGALDPRFSSIEEYLGLYTRNYYRVLAEVGGRSRRPEREARPWVRFVLRAHHQQAGRMAWEADRAGRLWGRLTELRTEAGLDERNMGSLYNAAMGFRVRRRDHIDYAGVSERVATSDLAKLAALGFLVAVGERRGRYYIAAAPLRSLASGDCPPIPDPFGV